MEGTKRAIIAGAAVVLFAAGILWWWPLAVLAVVVAAWVVPFFGIVLGLLLDIVWGAPQGALHFLYFPWTLLAILVALARYISPRFFFSRGSDTLS